MYGLWKSPILTPILQSLKLQSDIGQFLTSFGSCLTKNQFGQTKWYNKDNIISVNVKSKFHNVWTILGLFWHFKDLILGIHSSLTGTFSYHKNVTQIISFCCWKIYNTSIYETLLICQLVLIRISVLLLLISATDIDSDILSVSLMNFTNMTDIIDMLISLPIPIPMLISVHPY